MVESCAWWLLPFDSSHHSPRIVCQKRSSIFLQALSLLSSWVLSADCYGHSETTGSLSNHATSCMEYLAKRLVDAVQKEGLEIGSTGILDQHRSNAGFLVAAHETGMAGYLAKMSLNFDIAISGDEDSVAVRDYLRARKLRRL